MDDHTVSQDTSAVLNDELRREFEQIGEATARAEIARGGRDAFAGEGVKRKAATEWLAERESARILERGTPVRYSIIGPAVGLGLFIAAIVFVISLHSS